jgi:regulatory protein
VKFLDLAAALQKAYRLLSLRPHSEKELEKKLREKGFPAVVIKETLEKLHDLKYLNDASFATGLARNLAVNKLWGNRKIIASLQEKGIAAQLIDDAIAAARLEISEDEAIAVLVQKKVSKKKPAVFDIKEKHKISKSCGTRFSAGLDSK